MRDTGAQSEGNQSSKPCHRKASLVGGITGGFLVAFLVHGLLEIPSPLLEALLQLADSAADTAQKLRDLLAAEQNEDDDQDDPKLLALGD